MTNLRNALIEVFKERGLNAYRYAKLFGANESQINHILSGRRDCTLFTLEEILDNLNVEIELILQEFQPPENPPPRRHRPNRKKLADTIHRTPNDPPISPTVYPLAPMKRARQPQKLEIHGIRMQPLSQRIDCKAERRHRP